jgi:hypothetical protein
LLGIAKKHSAISVQPKPKPHHGVVMTESGPKRA